jgi:hypothetical protein
MKYTLLLGFLLSSGGLAQADMLRLRNGIEFTGHYIGGTKTEIWFEREGMVNTTEIIPTSMVEALKFEPGSGSPAAAAVPESRAQSWLAYFKTVFATAWFPNASSTRTATVTSPGGRLLIPMR